jgi:hypothetical protein
MKELFSEEEMKMKSPYLLFMEKHNIHTKYRRDLPGPDVPRWEAYTGDYDEAINSVIQSQDDPELSKRLTVGFSIEKAIENLCVNRGIIQAY